MISDTRGLYVPGSCAKKLKIMYKFHVNGIVKYLELIRFSHTLFALPFALLSAAMALKLNWGETPPIPLRVVDVAGILLCMVFARSAAMGFNRWADRKIDAENPRTVGRHLPAGTLQATSVLLFVFVCTLGFVLSTLLFLPNRIPIFASLPLLSFLFCYSYTKRWTVASHFWLGAALMLAPLAAWIAIRPVLTPIPWPPVLLGLAVLFWSTSFDLIYACQDAQHDAQAKLFSVPGRFGIPAAFRMAAACHLAAVLFFATIPFVYGPFGVLFQTGVALVALILLAEHYVAAPRRGGAIDLVRVNVAFFQMNVVVSVGLFVLGTVDLFL